MKPARRAVLGLLFLLAVVTVPAAHPQALPPEISRFNPAGLSQEWRYEGVAFQVLSAPGAGVSAIPVHRLAHPRHGFLLTASDGEIATARAAGFVDQGIAFHVPGAGGIPVYRFHAASGEGYFYSTDPGGNHDPAYVREGVAFNAVGPGVDGAAMPVWRYRNAVSRLFLFTAGSESRYQVGAFYFGSFTPSAVEIIAGTQRVHGRSGDWWGGVKDFYGMEPGVSADRRGWSGDFSELKPAIGYYDQDSVAVLEQHIAQAADAGLSFFSFYWYWSNQKHGELLPEALHSFLGARNSQRMRFALTLYAHPWNNDLAITADNAHSVVEELVRYFRMPQYLRLPDGRPLFSIGDSRNIRPGNGAMCSADPCYAQVISDFLGLLNSVSQRELGVTPFVEIQAGVPTWGRHPEIDAISCLTPPMPINAATEYPAFTTAIFAQLRGPGKPVSPCMLENFDERPRQDILIPDRNAIRYLVGKTNAKFRHNLEAARQFSDEDFARTGSPASHIVLLYAWNEWHEGGIIEPNATTGAATLNVVTDVFQLPRAPSRCLDEGRCALDPGGR